MLAIVRLLGCIEKQQTRILLKFHQKQLTRADDKQLNLRIEFIETQNRLRSTTAVDKQNIADGAKTMKTSPSFRVPDEVIVCIKDARFSWDAKDDSNDLEIDHLSIPKGIV